MRWSGQTVFMVWGGTRCARHGDALFPRSLVRCDEVHLTSHKQQKQLSFCTSSLSVGCLPHVQGYCCAVGSRDPRYSWSCSELIQDCHQGVYASIGLGSFNKKQTIPYAPTQSRSCLRLRLHKQVLELQIVN